MRTIKILMPGWLARACGAVLGCVFLAAAAAKAIDPVGFAGGIEAYGIVTGTTSTRVLALAVICAEAGVGVCLILRVAYRRALVGAALLLGVFAGASGWALARGQTHGCGCFGSLAERTPAETLAEDAGLLGLAGLAFLRAPVGGQPGGRWRAQAALGAVLAGALLPPLAVRFHPPLAEGKSLIDLGVDGYLSGDPPDRALLGFLDPLERGPAATGLEALARLGIRVLALSSAEQEQIEAFRWSAGTSYAIVTIPRPLLRRLSGDRTGAFLVSEGKVERVWRGRIPEPHEMRELEGRSAPAPPLKEETGE